MDFLNRKGCHYNANIIQLDNYLLMVKDVHCQKAETLALSQLAFQKAEALTFKSVILNLGQQLQVSRGRHR
jgi:hypothetical protein